MSGDVKVDCAGATFAILPVPTESDQASGIMNFGAGVEVCLDVKGWTPRFGVDWQRVGVRGFGARPNDHIRFKLGIDNPSSHPNGTPISRWYSGINQTSSLLGSVSLSSGEAALGVQSDLSLIGVHFLGGDKGLTWDLLVVRLGARLAGSDRAMAELEIQVVTKIMFDGVAPIGRADRSNFQNVFLDTSNAASLLLISGSLDRQLQRAGTWNPETLGPLGLAGGLVDYPLALDMQRLARAIPDEGELPVGIPSTIAGLALIFLGGYFGQTDMANAGSHLFGSFGIPLLLDGTGKERGRDHALGVGLAGLGTSATSIPFLISSDRDMKNTGWTIMGNGFGIAVSGPLDPRKWKGNW